LVSVYGLNDWFAFELVRKYAECLVGNPSGKVLLQHFLLTHMGYDVRLASTREKLLLLVPFKQQVYGRNYLLIDGEKYYTFHSEETASQDEGIYTCRLPKNADTGRRLDLTFSGKGLLIQSGKVRTGEWGDGCLKLNASVDEGTMEALRHYPQMDVPCYALSCISPEFHERLLSQMSAQLQGLSEQEAVSRLLHFVQHAFAYATDDEQHGYEKPYFIEENFFYPENDCEDRAILFAFLVRNLLNLDVHLVHYPGHECTAVNFSSPLVNGDGYRYNGTTYYICDPTYIGASLGQCMPSYLSMKPIVEEWY